MLEANMTPEAQMIKRPVDIAMLSIIIRGLRKGAGLKQQQLGDLANVSDSTVSYVESGKCQNIVTSIRVLEALGYTVQLHITPTKP